MYKGLIIVLSSAVVAMAAANPLAAQVYKVVDEHGNVTYTDQPPADGAEPMELPEITVIETPYATEAQAAGDGEQMSAIVTPGQEDRTPRELRQMFNDFRIISPAPEETYWGTANTVVISWGANAPYEPGMSVSVVLDGNTQNADPSANLPVTLERGEHQVYAVLRDQRGRRIATTSTVKFYVHQNSRLINPG